MFLLQDCFDPDCHDCDASLEQAFALGDDDVISSEFARNLQDASLSPATVVERLFNFYTDSATPVTQKPPAVPRTPPTKKHAVTSRRSDI